MSLVWFFIQAISFTFISNGVNQHGRRTKYHRESESVLVLHGMITRVVVISLLAKLYHLDL
jgi:hypothetical protein